MSYAYFLCICCVAYEIFLYIYTFPFFQPVLRIKSNRKSLYILYTSIHQFLYRFIIMILPIRKRRTDTRYECRFIRNLYRILSCF